jgi:hypothetical protein
LHSTYYNKNASIPDKAALADEKEPVGSSGTALVDLVPDSLAATRFLSRLLQTWNEWKV